LKCNTKCRWEIKGRRTQDSGLGTQDEKEKAPGIILIKHRSQKAQARASESQHVLDVLVVLLPIAFSYIQFFCSNFDFTFSPARTLHFLPISGVYFCALRLLSTFKLIRSAIIQSKIAEVAKAEVRSGGLPKKKEHKRNAKEPKRKPKMTWRTHRREEQGGNGGIGIY